MSGTPALKTPKVKTPNISGAVVSVGAGLVGTLSATTASNYFTITSTGSNPIVEMYAVKKRKPRVKKVMDFKPVEDFIKSGNGNAWLKIGKLNIFVRSTQRLDPLGTPARTFDVANADIPNKTDRNKGTFTKFLNGLIPLVKEHGYQMIYAENLVNTSLINLFERLEYTAVPNTYPICYQKMLY